MSFLITGGAGYIGSHVVRALALAGEQVVAYDDLSTGDASRVPDGVPFVQGTTLDRGLLDRTIADHRVTAVIHLAAKKQACESMAQPLRYYRENLHGLQILLEAARGNRVGRFVFSSSATVYGAPDTEPATEDTRCAPATPYGETKLVGEWLVRDAGRAYRMSTACLRHVNVAGAAAPELADTGGDGLIPMTFEYLSAGSPPRIFGADYPTPDGTCVRDYIHVEDLAEAHVATARALAEQPEPEHLTLNIGRGQGVSVREMVTLIAQITGHEDLSPVVAPRRPGDPARVVVSPELAAKHLGWTARRDVAAMVTSAWAGWLCRGTA
ncbi:UDP-glucose 4-epimerase GalE [Streptomyces sp. NBC_01803]|uniref:UDP-glucose 4-epimerase GalE n=1 Tax=Streptomyces sp. NBC_01803 TaxID=2975946 RepID=UPI002DDBCF1F|nr:UDP-glucose 4-epimerase GalE [Streptomyces sp. NBC_01803]WSA44442.1 UDP-glucose 4-epimerase GalE [Streptomyces sp. NBC_01803]